MPSFRLSDRARADLVDIYDFTEINFGAYQADAYHAGLERTFGLLADFPRIGQPADELRASYRRFRFQSHYVFYTDEGDHVVIRAVYTRPKISARRFLTDRVPGYRAVTAFSSVSAICSWTNSSAKPSSRFRTTRDWTLPSNTSDFSGGRF